jgi:hypothetical protein
MLPNPPHSRWRGIRHPALIGGAVIVVPAILFFATFSSLSVCAICGCRCHTWDHQLPLTSLTYFRHRHVEATPLSDLVERLRLTPKHTHDWKLIHGGGNGVMCAIGSGGDLDRNARSERVVSFIEDTERYDGRAEASQWFKTALHERDSKALSYWLLYERYPEEGFVDSASYAAWRESADPRWPEVVEENRKRW